MTLDDVKGSLASLIHTLKGRLDELGGEAVSPRAIGALMRAGALRRGMQDAPGLGDVDPRYAHVVTALDAAARRLAGANADAKEEVLEAFDLVDAALDLVSVLQVK